MTIYDCPECGKTFIKFDVERERVRVRETIEKLKKEIIDRGSTDWYAESFALNRVLSALGYDDKKEQTFNGDWR
jgi:hypothetical protein